MLHDWERNLRRREEALNSTAGDPQRSSIPAESQAQLPQREPVKDDQYETRSEPGQRSSITSVDHFYSAFDNHPRSCNHNPKKDQGLLSDQEIMQIRFRQHNIPTTPLVIPNHRTTST